jgi:RimJ/RimL family protein N-acetyltransferase
VNGKIIASVRGHLDGDSAHILRVIVHPYFRGRGLAGRLIKEIEQAFPGVKRFEAFTGHKSKRNLAALARHGYREFKTVPGGPGINWIYLEKILP